MIGEVGKEIRSSESKACTQFSSAVALVTTQHLASIEERATGRYFLELHKIGLEPK